MPKPLQTRTLRWLVLPLLLAASACATKPPQEEPLTTGLKLPPVQSVVNLPPTPSEQQQRVETILQRLDSEMAGLLNLLPPPTPKKPEPTR